MNTDASHATDRVVIVGGGLAGLAAAVRLAEHDAPVTLIESRAQLGGRATSVTDPDTGQVLDHCPHLLMRCATNLRDFYERLGVEDRIDWHRALHFADSHGQIDTLEADDLPAPLHLLRPLLGLKTLTPGERFAVARGMLGVLQVSRRGRSHHAHESFRDWLQHHRQPRSAIDKFWSLILAGACNQRPEHIAASYAIQLLQEGLLYDSHAYELGLPTTSLAELYELARQRIEAVGGQIMLNVTAEQFLHDEQQNRITYLRLSDHQEVTGSAFISTVAPDRLARLAPETLASQDPRFAALDRFETSPVVGVHLFFRVPLQNQDQHQDQDAPVMTLPHLAMVDGQVQWVFNKETEKSSDGGDVQHLHAVISGAHDLIHLPDDQLASLAVTELRQALPAARRAELVRSRVLKDKHATFAAGPGVDAIRPAVEPEPDRSAGNLYLAGDWVQTHWPATMESAVRSGYRAAAAILRDRGQEASPLPAHDLKPSPLYRMLSA